MSCHHTFASTSISIDVKDGPVYITGFTSIFVGKLVRFLSILQWGRLVTYKGKVDRFSVKCERCTYGLSGTKCDEEKHLWKLSVHKSHGGNEFTPLHTNECPFFGSIQDPPHLLRDIPQGLETFLSSEDLFILRRLGVSFLEKNLDKRVLKRSKELPIKWNVEGFITYVLHYRDDDSAIAPTNLDSALPPTKHEQQSQLSSLPSTIPPGLPQEQYNSIAVFPSTGSTPSTPSHQDGDTHAVVINKESSPIIMDPNNMTTISASKVVNCNSPLEKEEGSTIFTYSPMENTFLGVTSSPLSYGDLLPDYFESEASKTISLKRKVSHDYDNTAAGTISTAAGTVGIVGSSVNLCDATDFANQCIDLSHLLPLNTDLGKSLAVQLKHLKATKCYMATQGQVLSNNLCEMLEELQSYKKIKLAPASALSVKPRTECSICHLMQEDVCPSLHCSHQFCVDCFIVIGNCPICPLNELSMRKGPPVKKARTSPRDNISHDIIMFTTYKNIVESCTEKKMWALMKLAQCYEDGIGIGEDFAKSVEYYILSADGGNKYAQYRLAQLYKDGEGVTQSAEHATRWYDAAARQGHFGAKGMIATDFNAGANFLFTHIMEEECEYKCDYITCEWKFYDLCSKFGNFEASRYIGDCFLTGSGLEEEINFASAVNYFELASSQGDTAILPQLWYARGCMHYYATGVARFVEGACQCFYQAAILGHRISMERYLSCIIPAFASLQSIGVSPEKFVSMNDANLMKIVEHFAKEEKSHAEYLQVYFKRESRYPPPADIFPLRAPIAENNDSRLIRIQRVLAKNYACRKSFS